MNPNREQDRDTQPGRMPPTRRMPLPGVAAIAFYLLLESGWIVIGTVGGHFPWMYLFFAVAFITASGGLVASFRWAWALALSAVLLISGFNLWIFSAQHVYAHLALGLLNLFFFLYLVRPEVRARLR